VNQCIRFSFFFAIGVFATQLALGQQTLGLGGGGNPLYEKTKDGFIKYWSGRRTNNGERVIKHSCQLKNDKKHGWERFYGDKGEKWEETHYKNGKRDGRYTKWFGLEYGGKKYRETHYKDDKEHGRETTWFDNGQKRFEVNYENGQLQGWFLEWDLDGKKIKEDFYNNGEFLYSKQG